MKKIIALVVIGILAPLAFARINEYPKISFHELKQAVDSKHVALLDVSGTAAFRAGHIPGAIDYFASKDSLDAKLPADKTSLIIVYCATEACPDYTTAAAAAVDLGYYNIRYYAPGLAEWKKAGGPVEKSPAN